MANKKILNVLVLIIVVSLACAAIYATETSGEVSHVDSSSSADIHISGSDNVKQVMGSVSPFSQGNNVTNLALHI